MGGACGLLVSAGWLESRSAARPRRRCTAPAGADRPPRPIERAASRGGRRSRWRRTNEDSELALDLHHGGRHQADVPQEPARARRRATAASRPSASGHTRRRARGPGRRRSTLLWVGGTAQRRYPSRGVGQHDLDGVAVRDPAPTASRGGGCRCRGTGSRGTAPTPSASDRRATRMGGSSVVTSGDSRRKIRLRR